MSPTLYRRVLLPESPAPSVSDDPDRWSVLVADGRVVEIRPDAEPGQLSGHGRGAEALKVVDLDGALLLPGFVDAHAHVTETGLLLAGVDCSRARTVGQILDAVADLAKANPGRQVLGHGWDELNLVEGRPPTVQELDRAGGGAVVYLSRVDVHSAVVSGRLAERAGLRGLEGWDENGRVERDAHHVARLATRFRLPAAERSELQHRALRHAAAQGITQVHEMSAPHIAPDEDLLALLDLDPEAGLPRIVAYRGELAHDEAAARAVLERFGGRLAGLAGDLMMDGSFGSRTAGLCADYEDAHGHRGHLYADAAQVRDHLVACTKAGTQGGFHVIGDGAVSELLNGLRQAAELLGRKALRAAGHRLEHVEGISGDDVQVLADLNVMASVQPAFDAFWGGPGQMYAVRLGERRALAMNPFADLHAAGVGLAFGSDSPVTPFAPWEGVRAALLHHNESQRLGIRTAIEAHTLGGLRAARLSGASDNRGLRLRAGDPAVFTAWTSPGIKEAGAAGTPLALLGQELAQGGPVPQLVKVLREHC